MNKFLKRIVSREVWLTGAFCCISLGSVLAQSANSAAQVIPSGTSAKGIGPAPANTPQNQILNSALSPKTRQTLQDAMNSAK